MEIPNPGHPLKPGMYARVELLLDVVKGALLVPLEAVGGAEGHPSVLVVRDGKVASVPIRLGAPDGPRVQVVQGLTLTDRVILQGKELV